MSFRVVPGLEIPPYLGFEDREEVVNTLVGVRGTGDEGYYALQMLHSNFGSRFLIARDYPVPAIAVDGTRYEPTLQCCNGCGSYKAMGQDRWLYYSPSQGGWIIGEALGWEPQWDDDAETGDGWYEVVMRGWDEDGEAIGRGRYERQSMSASWYWDRWGKRTTLGTQTPLGEYPLYWGLARGTRHLGNPAWVRRDTGEEYRATTVYEVDTRQFAIGSLRWNKDVRMWVDGGHTAGEVYAAAGYVLGEDMLLMPCHWEGRQLVLDTDAARPSITLSWSGWKPGDEAHRKDPAYWADGCIWR